MTIDLASRSLRTIKRRGLRIRVFGMPITLQYGVVVKMHGRPYCPRRGHGAPPAKLLASPVVKVPQHPADATRTLPPLPINPAKIHLCVGGAYDFTVPARPPVFAAASVRVTLTK